MIGDKISDMEASYSSGIRKNYLITKNIVDSILKNDNKIKLIFAGSSQMFKKTNGIVNEKSKFIIYKQDFLNASEPIRKGIHHFRSN